MSEHPVDDLAAYALGTLEPRAARAVREHLAGCASCAREEAETRAVLDLLPHALDPIVPTADLRERVLARALAQPPPSRSGPRVTIAVLAASLALALVGDIWFGLAARRASAPAVVAVATTASHAAPVAAVPPRSPRFRPSAAPASPDRRPSSRAARHAPVPQPPPIVAATAPPPIVAASAPPTPRATPADRTPPLARALARALRDRDRTLAAWRAQSTRDAGRIALLRFRLARADAMPTQTALLGALATGRTYGIDGRLDGVAWRGAVLQPAAGANAIVVTQTPEAPAGDDYHVWVVRGGRTFDAGALPAATQATLEMPMPVLAGDVIGFSRERDGAVRAPSGPFLMQIAIER